MDKIFTWILFLQILTGCKQKTDHEKAPAINVTGYLKGQLKLLDTIPYGILKITETGKGSPDSVYLKKDALAKMIAPFLSSEIDQVNLERNYEEKSFADVSTQSFNITYDTKNKESIIHQVVLYIDPASGNINQVYITGYIKSDNKLIKKQLLWMHNKGFQIISSFGEATNEGESVIEKIYWQ
jgi:hypothetical protein